MPTACSTSRRGTRPHLRVLSVVGDDIVVERPHLFDFADNVIPDREVRRRVRGAQREDITGPQTDEVADVAEHLARA